MAMTNDDYKHFVCIVASENPQSLIAEYDKNKQTERHIVYKYCDAPKLRSKYIQVYEDSLNQNLNETQREYVKMMIDEISEMNDDEFYNDITQGLDIDDETGDATTTTNQNGKWSSCNIGKFFSMPFLTKDGREVYQARKGEIDWSKVHLNNDNVYARAWEMVIDGDKPKNDIEKTIYENMKDKISYFKKFDNKDNYITSNTSFWGYAFLSDKIGWVDADDCADQFAWMKNFFDVFIKNLPNDTLLTIYECTK